MATAHRQKRDLYHWIALETIYPGIRVRFKTNGWISSNLEMKTLQAINLQAPIGNEIPSAGELLLELRLYESLLIITGGANAPFQVREPPAGPPKIRLL